MTFLQLVNSLKQETGVAGADFSTVSGLTKEPKRLADWIAQSWLEIQMERTDWDFMRKAVTFNTVDGQQQYHVGDGLDIDIDDFGSWRNESFRSYIQSAGVATEIILTQYYSYSGFRDFYMLGSRRLVTGRPLYITINPNDRSLLLGFTPNDIYVVSGEYFQTPQVLTADADEPIMPSRYHMAIVYKAMMKYGLFMSAQEQITAGQQGYSMLFNRMINDQTPIVQIGESLI